MVTPDELLDAAVALAAGDREVDWRNATSRAYYAAFHRCRLVAAAEGIPEAGTQSAHAGLVDGLTYHRNPRALRSLGFILEQCRTKRVVADYEIGVYEIGADFDRDVAHTVLAESRRIFDRSASLVPS